MPDDILDAAQKAIDDAAKHTDASSSLPPEPAPEPPAPPPAAEKILDEVLPPLANPPPTVEPPKPPPPPPKKKISGVLVALFLLILGGSVAVGSYFVSQRQQIMDTRSSARGTEPCKVCQGTGCVDSGVPARECSPSFNECSKDTDCVEKDTPKNTPKDTGKDSCGTGFTCKSYAGGTACLNAGGDIDACTKKGGGIGNCCAPVGGGGGGGGDDNQCIGKGKCVGPGEDCCGGGYFDATCAVTEMRCGTSSSACTDPKPVKCGDQCVDTRTDNNNCGTCGNKCPGGSDCSGYSCVSKVPANCANVGCSGDTCTVDGMFPGCAVNHYKCNAVLPRGTGCQENPKYGLRSATLNANCGTEQIDIRCDVCPGHGGLEAKKGNFITKYYSKPCGPGGGDDDDDNVKPPKCQLIKIYKGNQEVTPSTLKPGDNVKLAVKGNKPGQKARFRVNGGDWSETTTKNPTTQEWTTDYTIPSGVTDFVIEGEVFIGGAWR